MILSLTIRMYMIATSIHSKFRNLRQLNMIEIMNNLGSGPKEATNTIAMSMNAVKIMTIIKVITIKMIMLTSTNPKSSILMIQEMNTWRNRTKE